MDNLINNYKKDNFLNENFKYITGKYALNIHNSEDKNEPTGDWNSYIWDDIKELPNENITYAGINCSINTNRIWGNYGIYDNTKYFIKKGIKVKEKYIYVANYYRAILDIIYNNIDKYGNLYGVKYLTYDYLDNDVQINIVINKLKLLEKHINKNKYDIVKEWIYDEINYENNRL